MSLDSSMHLLSAVDHVMRSSEMRTVAKAQTEHWPEGSRVYEDWYSIVGCFYYDSFTRLSDQWLDAQELLVSLLSANLRPGDAKSWDGYLVLLTSGSVSRGQALKLVEIRSNTRRVRKVVITGDDLRLTESGDILPLLRRSLGPVLPLTIQVQPQPTDPLASLAARLSHSAARTEQVTAVLEAYRMGKPLLTALHDHLDSKNGPAKGGIGV